MDGHGFVSGSAAASRHDDAVKLNKIGPPEPVFKTLAIACASLEKAIAVTSEIETKVCTGPALEQGEIGEAAQLPHMAEFLRAKLDQLNTKLNRIHACLGISGERDR